VKESVESKGGGGGNRSEGIGLAVVCRKYPVVRCGNRSRMQDMGQACGDGAQERMGDCEIGEGTKLMRL